VQAYQAQVVLAEAEEAFDGNDIPVDPWTFSGALLYSITVITTIGETEETVQMFSLNWTLLSF
jgi:hypothetical protein